MSKEPESFKVVENYNYFAILALRTELERIEKEIKANKKGTKSWLKWIVGVLEKSGEKGAIKPATW